MTTFSIGRIGVALANGGDGLDLAHPFAWQQNGRNVSLQGRHEAASQAAAVFFVNQILGLDPQNNPDEKYIPVYSATVTELNGWFAVLAVSATINPGTFGTGGTLFVDWQIQIVRAAAWRRPKIEIPTAYAGVVNGWGVTSAYLLESMPGTVVNRGLTTTGGLTRAGERGTVNLGSLAGWTPASWPGADYDTSRYVVDPDDFYIGAPYIEDTTLGSTYVGRADIGTSFARIGNGLVRVLGQVGSTCQLTFQWWDGAAWTSGVAFNFSIGYFLGYTTAPTIASAVIIKNAADECILRFACFQTFSPLGSDLDNINVDVSCRRGDRCVRIFMSGGFFGAQMAAASATAGTSKAWGMRFTSAVDSEYVVMTSDYGTTRDLVNGSLSASTGYPPIMFGLGVSSGGGTGTGLNDADGVGSQLMAVYGTTQDVVVS